MRLLAFDLPLNYHRLHGLGLETGDDVRPMQSLVSSICSADVLCMYVVEGYETSYLLFSSEGNHTAYSALRWVVGNSLLTTLSTLSWIGRRAMWKCGKTCLF